VSVWVERTCTVASLRNSGDLSIRKLFESADPVLSSRHEFLRAATDWFGAHPAEVEHWLDYSADKRSSPSPYLRPVPRQPDQADEPYGYEVGFFDKMLGHLDVIHHVDAAEAAADFLYREATWVLQRRQVS
jgi:hypothetical protein